MTSDVATRGPSSGWLAGAPWAAAVAAVCLLVTFVLWRQATDLAASEDRMRFERQAERIQASLDARLRDYQVALHAGRGLFAASRPVTRAAWREFVEGMGIRGGFPGMVGLGFLARVPAARLDAFVAAARADGAPGFAVRTPPAEDGGAQAPDADRAIALYMEPERDNLPAIGLDASARPVVREALARARDTGGVVVSARLRLVQESAEQWSTILYAPVYRPGAPLATVEDRRAALEGWVAAPLRMRDFMLAERTDAWAGIDVELFDGQASAASAILFDADDCVGEAVARGVHEPHPDRRFTETSAFRVGGRSWSVRLSTLPEWAAARSSGDRTPAAVLAVGFALSVLLAGLTGFLSAARERARAIALDRNAALRASEAGFRSLVANIPGAVYRASPGADWTLHYVSGAIRDITGLPPEAFAGPGARSYASVVHPDDLPEVARRFGEAVAARTSFELEYRVAHASGEWRWVQERGQAVYGDDGVPLYVGGVVVDATARRAAEDALRESEERTRLVVESALDAVVTLDAAGVVTGWNGRAETVFGWTRAEAVGKRFSDAVLAPAHREAQEEALLRFLASGDASELSRRVEVVGGHRDGREFPIELAVTPLKSGSSWSFSAFVRDITDRRWAEEALRKYVVDLESSRDRVQDQASQLERQASELREARDQAEAATRAKSDFLATVSHEIRTPMNGVIGMTGLLLDTDLTAEQRDHAATIQTSAEALLGLINDILDFSKIEAGRLSLEPIPFDVRVAFEEVVELLAPKACEKHLEIALRWAPGTPQRFVGDPGRIRQVLVNLVGNAVKFTERGHVLVDVACEDPRGEGGPCGEDPGARAEGASESRSCTLRVRVEDTGIGIPEEKVPLLFQRFSQADSSTTRRFGGTGLGLAISKHLVERMGGTIGVESEAGRGSAFWFRLPLPLDAEQPETAAPDADLVGVRALVVDDVDVHRRILVELLSRWGLRPEEAPSAAEGLDLLRRAVAEQDPCRLALLDWGMPDTDGLELGRAIQAEPALAGAGMLLLTSSAQKGDAKRAREAGFSAFLVKPVRASDLHDAVSTVWSHAARGALPRALVTRHTLAEARASGAGAGRARATPARCRVLLAEDNAVNQKVAARMLEKMGARVDVAANGREAVDMALRLPYDLVFMDCQMPEMDGYDATAAIRRADGSGARVPIVAMTANALDGAREHCLEAGMDDYVAKPVKPEDLRRVLARFASPAADRRAALRATRA